MTGNLAPVLLGWFADPADPGQLRFFDGAAWTEQTKVPTEQEADAARRRVLRPAAHFWATHTRAGAGAEPSTGPAPVRQAEADSPTARHAAGYAPPLGTTMWTVVSDGRVMGDFAEQQLVMWTANGQVKPTDLFWCPGMSAAAPAQTLHPFAQYFHQHQYVASAPATSSLGDSSVMRWILPVGRSPWAIAAGYLGLCSILPVFGPLAIVAGILGVAQIKRNARMHGLGRAIFGIVAGILGTLALVAFLRGGHLS